MSSDSDEIAYLDDDITKIRTKPCWICGQHSYINLPIDAWRTYDMQDIPLDVAWPEGSAADKLLILTGVHPKCWDEEFPDDAAKEK